MKLEPLAKFIGKGLPTVRDWVEKIENWLELSLCTPDQWIAIAGTKLEKGASSWFRVEKAKMREGRCDDWFTWELFTQEIIAGFSSITKEEQARKLLKGLNQTQNIQNYVQRFRDLSLHIPSMSQADKFAAFMDGLKPAIRQQIAPHVSTLAEAQIMATKVDLYSSQGSRGSMRSGSGSGGGKQKMGDKNKGRGQVGMVE